MQREGKKKVHVVSKQITRQKSEAWRKKWKHAHNKQPQHYEGGTLRHKKRKRRIEDSKTLKVINQINAQQKKHANFLCACNGALFLLEKRNHQSQNILMSDSTNPRTLK
jgi:hypothetical protein